MSPFDCWWKIYPNKPHARKSHKEKKCRPLFDSFDLETQRLIYQDTKQRIRSDSWLKGFYCAPLVYLRAEPWLDPIEFNNSVRDTTSGLSVCPDCRSHKSSEYHQQQCRLGA